MTIDNTPSSSSKKTIPLAARTLKSLSAPERRDVDYERLLEWLQRVVSNKPLQKRKSVRTELLERYEELCRQNDPVKKEAVNLATQALIAIVTGTAVMPFQRKMPVMTCDFLMEKVADEKAALAVRVDALAAVDWARYENTRDADGKKNDILAIEALFKKLFVKPGLQETDKDSAQQQQQKAFAAVEAPIQRRMDGKKQKWIGNDKAIVNLLSYPVRHAIGLRLQAQAMSFGYTYIDRVVKESDEALTCFEYLNKSASGKLPVEADYLSRKIALLSMQQELKKECAACATLLQTHEKLADKHEAVKKQILLAQEVADFNATRAKFDAEVEKPALFADYASLCGAGFFKP